MSGFNKFVVAALLAVGGGGGAAVVDSPVLGAASARADGVNYFNTRSEAETFAARARKLGYNTTILKTAGGLYRVDYSSGH